MNEKRYLGVWSVTDTRGGVRPVAVEWEGERCPVRMVAPPRPMGGHGRGKGAAKYRVATPDGRIHELLCEDPRWCVEVEGDGLTA